MGGKGIKKFLEFFSFFVVVFSMTCSFFFFTLDLKNPFL